MVKEAKIYVSKMDLERLTRVIEITRESDDNSGKLGHLDRLEEELDRADVVDPKDVPSDVITMRSKVRLKDLSTGEEMVYSLVFPTEANLDEGKISVLAPIGTAMLGYSRGDVIEWEVPSGVRRLKVEQVIYQPESSVASIVLCKRSSVI